MIENNQLNSLEDKVVTEFIENYSVIVIDPAWPSNKIIRKVRPNQVGMDYPTMTLEEIRNFKLPEVSDCHLFLWTTEKQLPNSFEVLKVWGFRYIVVLF